MSKPETPLSPGRYSPPPDSGAPGVLTMVVSRFVYPARAPFTSITLYYVLILAAAWLMYRYVPGAAAAFSGGRLTDLMSSGGSFSAALDAAPPPAAGIGFSLQFALSLAAAMIGAALLMIPASVVYMATHQTKGMDQNVVQTMLILALSVAGVIVIVRNSLALAFSLAGVVGAVRYRHSLRDPRDTLYVFLAIGVGLAAGVEALPAAVALSMVFSYAILILTRLDYGMCELRRPAAHLLMTAASARSAETEPEGEFAKTGKSDKKKKSADFNAVLVVRATSAAPGQEVVERFLGDQVKRWRLAEIETNALGGMVHLTYLLRLRRKKERTEIEDALVAIGAPHVVGAKVH